MEKIIFFAPGTLLDPPVPPPPPVQAVAALWFHQVTSGTGV